MKIKNKTFLYKNNITCKIKIKSPIKPNLTQIETVRKNQKEKNSNRKNKKKLQNLYFT